jgi:hypothetical protein
VKRNRAKDGVDVILCKSVVPYLLHQYQVSIIVLPLHAVEVLFVKYLESHQVIDDDIASSTSNFLFRKLMRTVSDTDFLLVQSPLQRM